MFEIPLQSVAIKDTGSDELIDSRLTAHTGHVYAIIDRIMDLCYSLLSCSLPKDNVIGHKNTEWTLS